MTRLVVAVLTYRRPDDLLAVLPELVDQVRACSTPTDLLVVDNDADGSGAATVSASAWAGDVRCVVEPAPGIAAARNRAIEEAAEHDLLVFIDDDERPGPGWLQHLVDLQARTGAAAVVGPVVSSFQEPLDPWIADGGFFTRRRLDTGTPISIAATNNLLLDLRVVRRLGLRFDERFGISGGSDTLFTRQLTDSGAAMLWCDEAVVTDVVPVHRSTRQWVVRRALRSGNAWTRTALAARGAKSAWPVRAELVVRGGFRVVTGGAAVAAGALLARRPWRARGTKAVARGAGMVLGSVGWTYQEYRRPSPARTPAGSARG